MSDGSDVNSLLRLLHQERCERRGKRAGLEGRPATDGDEPALAGASAPVEAAEGGAPTTDAEAVDGDAIALHTWSASEVAGCAHARGAACLACAEGATVAVPWTGFVRLERAFADAGAMPRPAAHEATRSVSLRALVAGEVTWAGAFGVLAWAGARRGERFLDCGAGHGRAVAAFAACYGEALGIEIRPEVVATAERALQRLRAGVGVGAAGFADARVRCGDIFEPSAVWDADIVLLNCTGFEDALMKRCVAKLEEAPASPSRRVLVLSQPLHSSLLQCKGMRKFRMTWGQCTVYLYQQVS